MCMLILKPQNNIRGVFDVPGDKSISHRALIFSLFARGTSKIENLNDGADVATTLSFLLKEGRGLRSSLCYSQQYCGREDPRRAEGPFKNTAGNNTAEVEGTGLPFINKIKTFDCGNSGTTLALLLGILRNKCLLTGDQSLKGRNFSHHMNVLKECGIQFKFHEKEGFLPFEICPPSAIERIPRFTNIITSAQLKTTLLLTALNYDTRIEFQEKVPTRDHTERLLKSMGAHIEKEGHDIVMEGGAELKPLNLFVPGDISLASFFITATLLSENSHVILKSVSLNPTRLAFIKLLKEMKVRINITPRTVLKGTEVGSTSVPLRTVLAPPEPYGDIEVFSSPLEGGEVPVDMVGELIDEIPCLALLGLVARRGMIVRGAERLRNKETDRISALCYNLGVAGAKVHEFEDGFKVEPLVKKKTSFVIKSFQDHRMVMAFSLLAFLLKQDFSIDEPEWVKISYPHFFKDMFRL